jgi:hypothetical protein
MGVITHLAAGPGGLRRLCRYVRKFVIPLWTVFDPVILRRCERLPPLGGLSSLPHQAHFAGSPICR